MLTFQKTSRGEEEEEEEEEKKDGDDSGLELHSSTPKLSGHKLILLVICGGEKREEVSHGQIREEKNQYGRSEKGRRLIQVFGNGNCHNRHSN